MKTFNEYNLKLKGMRARHKKDGRIIRIVYVATDYFMVISRERLIKMPRDKIGFYEVLVPIRKVNKVPL